VVLYGRDVERDLIGALLQAARASRSGVLVVRGEAGIGKTALLEDARERAGDMRVLAARAVEAESELPFAALDQLIRPALRRLDQIPEPQAAALRAALGLADGSGEERFLVFAGCLSLLAELADQRPVLCLVDDAHSLDGASADALRFVARRLDAEGIALLFGAREGDVRGFEAADIPSLVLSGLGPEAAAVLLTRGAVDVSASVRERLVAQTHGNALALVELPSALSEAQLAGEEPLPDALPLTRQLESVFHDRVARLPDETRRLLLVAAADDSEEAGLVNQVGRELGTGPHALDAAEHAGLVSIHGARLTFRHPLVRSAVYASATSLERRAAHRALAAALVEEDQADRRAWHLAASAFEHDEEVVQALEEAAGRAQARAGYMAAAKALARAAELSADKLARGRRLVAAARSARIAGADDYAAALADQARPLVDRPSDRAELAFAVGLAAFRRGRPLDGFAKLIEAAQEDALAEPHRALEALIWAAGAASIGGDHAGLGSVARVAATLASAAQDESVLVAEALAAVARAVEGEPVDAAGRLEEAYAWASNADDAHHVFAVSVAAFFAGDRPRFATLIARAIALARARGELGTLAEALTLRAADLLMAQRFDDTELAATESAQFARDMGAANVAARPLGILAFCAAVHGDESETRRLADEVHAVAAAHGLPMHASAAEYALAMLDLGRGNWLEAFERLQGLLDPLTAGPLLARFALPNAIEAAVRAGRPEAAAASLAVFETWAAASGAGWAPPVVACCRGLLADGETATAHYEEALALRGDARPFDLARIQLLCGEHLRRERRRADARVQLRAALDAFERMRAEPWSERARAELRASGETARKRDPSTMSQLTPQELQIARLVAEGLANKEIAAQLFLSPRTIDSHLRNVFSKLAITSRTQLARLPLGDDDVGARPSPAGSA
jgi:DNA-binding CsgD family transcriptional regulator